MATSKALSLSSWNSYKTDDMEHWSFYDFSMTIKGYATELLWGRGISQALQTISRVWKTHTQLAKILRLTSIRHRTDILASNWCLINIHRRIFAIWTVSSVTMKGRHVLHSIYDMANHFQMTHNWSLVDHLWWNYVNCLLWIHNTILDLPSSL